MIFYLAWVIWGIGFVSLLMDNPIWAIGLMVLGVAWGLVSAALEGWLG